MGQPYTNDARNERSGHKEGGSVGRQGGYGSGEVKCSSADGKEDDEPGFKSAAEVIGAPIAGELEVPGMGVMKGASTPGYDAPKKGTPGSPMGGGSGIRKSKLAEDAGH